MSAQAGLAIVQVEESLTLSFGKQGLNNSPVQVKWFICGPLQMGKGYIWPFGKKEDTFGPVQIEKGYIW